MPAKLKQTPPWCGSLAIALSAPRNVHHLEVEPQLSAHASGSDEVRAAEGGNEVVESNLVGEVYNGEAQTPLVAVAVEQVVLAQSQIEQAAWLYSGRIQIRILRSRSRDLYSRGAVACCRTRGKRHRQGGGRLTRAEYSGLQLLIASQPG